MNDETTEKATRGDKRNNPDGDTRSALDTNARDIAGAARLLALMERRYPKSEFLARFQADTTEEEPRFRFVVMLVSAGLSATRSSLRAKGIPWEEMQAALWGEPASERARWGAKRVYRATRLLKHLVFQGCRRRGEVEGVQGQPA